MNHKKTSKTKKNYQIINKTLTGLACPDCKKRLTFSRNIYKCNCCGRRFFIEDRYIEALPLDFKNNDWVNDELDFWEDEYTKQKRIGQNNPQTGNRLYVRAKMIEYLLKHRKIKSNTRILDVGAGDGYTSYYLLNPDLIPHVYIAIDAAKNGLKLLRSKIKSAFTVRSTIESIPFLPNSFDVIFVWGVIHHTKNKERIIPSLTKLLKRNGYILLFEGLDVDTTFIKFSSKIMGLLTKESAHEERINEARMKKVLKENLKIVWYEKEYTPIRTGMVSLLVKIGIFDRFSLVNKLVINIDNMIIKTFGKRIKSFSGGAVSVIGVKR